MVPALLGCWIAGGAGFFLFSFIAWRRRRASGSIAAGTWRRRHSPGAQCRALSPDFPAGARGLYPLARGCRIRPARGMAPALMLCWIEGGAGFFLFSLLPGGAVELPGRSRPAPGGVDLRRVYSMSSSLSRFSGWRSRSLSLGEGLTDSTGAWDGTRADGVLDRGRRRLFSFWLYCLAAPSSYRVDRGRHLASSDRAGGGH